MMLNKAKLAKILTLMGGVPFIGAAILKTLGVDCPVLSIDDFTLRYGAVIISFICGIHWGIEITHTTQIRVSLLLISNLICLLAWMTILMDAAYYHYLIQVTCFVLLLTIDARLYQCDVINQWFYRLRKTITIIVSLSLLVLAVQI